MKKFSTIHMVLVDDDPDYAHLVEQAVAECQPAGSLKTLPSGPDLLAWLQTSPRPSIIFLDINMPGMNGFDVLKQLRHTERYRSIPVIMLSVSSGREDIQNAYHKGANSYIIKPTRFNELKRRIEFFTHYWFSVAQTPGAAWLRVDGFSTYEQN